MKLLRPFILLAIFVFLSTLSYAQVKTYEAQWKKVDDLVFKKRLPQSGLAEVKKIYALARKEGQEAQVVKALVYMTALQEETREDNIAQSIPELEAELKSAREPVASLLNSLLAGKYWQFLQNNRWKFYERTQTTNFVKNDINTWTLEDLHKKISELFLASIKNEQLLKTVRLQHYEAIIVKGNVRHLRPTLYDLLAHRALSYFRNDEADLKKPAYAFEIAQAEAFLPARQFVAYKFITRDSLSLHHKALLVYQDLIRFHLGDAKPDALVDVDLDRIAFVYQNSVHENKDSLYLQSLQSLITQYRGNPVVLQAQYLVALWHEQRAARYEPFGDTSLRYERMKARDLLLAIVKDSQVKNEGWINSYNLLQQIESRSFSFEIEKVNLPGLPFRSLIRYRNIEKLHFRLVRADEALRKSLERNDDNDKYWKLLTAAQPIRSWQQAMPATNDLQQHAVEIKIDSLPLGSYYLVASTDARFETKNQPLGARLFYVSNISYINREADFFVLHRQSGQPLRNAAVTTYRQEYDYKTSSTIKVKKDSYRADANGYMRVAIDKAQPYRDYLLEIVHGSDRLFMDESSYLYHYYNPSDRNEEGKGHLFFFTDRSIYRPRQTMHFKGIAIRMEGRNNKVLSNFTTKIFLADANGQYVDSAKVTTNEFGSFHASFTLPAGVLNGNFSLHNKDHTVHNEVFSVEEYKRPKFQVTFDKVEQAYTAGDTVRITGVAKAYAGNNIGDAKVNYRVVREPRFIYTWFFYKSWMPPVQPMEITHGSAVTDKDGKFSISFKAIPDRTIDRRYDPVFDYRIYADVTDINGETRSAESRVTAGYSALLLHFNAPERIAADSFKKLSVRTENMNGVFQPAQLTVTVNRLEPVNRLIRPRYWSQPDQFVMTRDEYQRNFPLDEYSNETDPKTWKRTPAFNWTDSSRVAGEITVNRAPWPAGFYEIEIRTKDKDGREIKNLRIVEVFDPASNTLNKPAYLWTKATDQPVEPGETTQVQIASSATPVFLINQVDRLAVDNKPVVDKIRKPIEEQQDSDFKFFTFTQGKQNFSFTATEEDRGGFGLVFFFVKDNRFYQYTHRVEVPWSNKELDIEFATFRDKTLPGSTEQWKVKIKGYKNEKVAAEVLASMYDASLDQFSPHAWEKPGIWPRYFTQLAWNSLPNFQSAQSDQRWIQERGNRYFEKIYDELAFDIYNLREQSYRKFYKSRDGMFDISGVTVTAVEGQKAQPPAIGNVRRNEALQDMAATDSTAVMDTRWAGQVAGSKIPGPADGVQARKNFNETAFFFPQLRTDADGNIEFTFTTPEALTRWKLQTMAHTRELAFGIGQKEVVTQKELMVQPNMPRFLRQGDQLELSAKIVNLSAKEMTGQAGLQLFDAATNTPVDGWFINTFPNQYFTVAPGQSEVVKFPVQVPFQFNSSLTWRIVARSGNFSDGEESIMPVLTNKVLVTETMPMPVRGTATKSFNFEKLLQSGGSPTLQHQSLTVEYTSNPAWYAVQALPYLMEYPYDCAEQVWNRYYANALASRIANASPRIKEIFEKWKTLDTAALLSNLQKNPELKSALLEETPWVLEAKTENEQKKNIALLFDMVRMNAELEGNLAKLRDMQSPNGGFVWFKGGPDDRFITQYIVTGIGRLKQLGVDIRPLAEILQLALPYLDKKIKEDYERLVKSKADLNKQQISAFQIQYLYMRSYFTGQQKATGKAYDYYLAQAGKFWAKQSQYLQGMIALAIFRNGNDAKVPAAILASLKETSIHHEELGRYWKDQRFGFSWFWWHAPVEMQALMVEAFSVIKADNSTVDELRTWLIKNKQTNNWRTTKATADACYALLLQGTDWLSHEPAVEIQLGTTTISSKSLKTEAGTGYFKQSIDGQKVKPEMGKITVAVTQPSSVTTPSWGAVYWQYFEDMDKVTAASTPLQLNKKLFREINTDRGPVLSPLADGATLQVGDKIKVRIELRVDRDMEYVHMKDMRASALEPVNVLSGYKWQGGLGYYESTRDAGTHFFFDHLRKGTYVFEYPLFVTHTGTFSNGITTIQCMYAPEFTAHSEGVKIVVE